MSKIFGPFIPQDIEKLSKELNGRGVPFRIQANELDRKAEISNAPENMVALAEFRTRNALGQMFYLELEENELAAHEDLEAKIWQITTGENIASMQDSGSTIDKATGDVEREQLEMQSQIANVKSKQRRIARLLIGGLLLYILISVYIKFNP